MSKKKEVFPKREVFPIVTRLLLSSLVLVLPASLAAATLTVAGSANIFGAGHASPPASLYGSGTLPSEWTFAPGSGQVLTFSSVSGQVNCCGGYDNEWSGPDGNPDFYGYGTDINSTGGIAGIQYMGRRMFMVGVFLDANEPTDPAPDRMIFTSPNDIATFSPLLNQVFFIGDGLMTDGTTAQLFNVPAGAGRLYLGFADGFYFAGNPDTYDDNIGALSAAFEISGGEATPEPGSAVLAIAGMAILAARLRKRLA
jgi:hypothetical protein